MRTFNEAEFMAAYSKLHGAAIILTKNKTEAEDLVQDTVEKMLSHAHTFLPGSNLAAWACTIMRNHYLTAKRKEKRHVSLDADYAYAQIACVDGAQIPTYILKKVGRAFEALPEEMRDAFMDIGILGHTYEQTSENLGVKKGTIKSRVSRARQRIIATYEDM